jgi:hypothetical protein
MFMGDWSEWMGFPYARLSCVGFAAPFFAHEPARRTLRYGQQQMSVSRPVSPGRRLAVLLIARDLPLASAKGRH